MIYLRHHTIRFRRHNRRRGSVIVLVVAVLALLAVIGTVYIVSARSQRSSANASNTAENVDLAAKAVNALAVGAIGEPMYDGNGTVGGLNAPGIFGIWAARRWDVPEINPSNIGYSNYNNQYRDQAWLVANLYRPVGLTFNDPFYNDLTVLTPNMFDPSTGQYDISFNNVGSFRVVADPLPGTPDDAYVQLLPFSEANGTRYRFGLRILDTSRMANLNVGMTFDVTSPNVMQASGTIFTEYSLKSPGIFVTSNNFGTAADNANALIGSNPGRLGLWSTTLTPDYAWAEAAFRFENPLLLGAPLSPFDLSDELELRAYGVLGTMAVPRPAMGYGPNTLWPNTLGNRVWNSNIIQGNLNRSYYTAYSYSRELRPWGDPVDPLTGNLIAFQTIPSSGTWAVAPPTNNSVVWPMFPERIAANPDISTYTTIGSQQAADTLAIAATNIATAMQMICNYSGDEARAFAANYLTSRWNSWTQITTTAVPSYTLLNGPSFVDQTGLCLRAYFNNANYSVNYNSDVKGAANKVYVGYAAQPFLNEAAISYHSDTTDPLNPKWIEVDSAIELYNPYDLPISLDDFKINVNGNDIDFTGQKLYVPNRGYFVITMVKGGLDTLPTPIPATAVKTDAATISVTLSLKDATTMYLMRRYIDRSGTKQWAAVDQYDLTAIGTAPATPTGPDEIDFEARPNEDDGTPASYLTRWVATVHDPTVAEVKQQNSGLTLGTANASTNAATALVPLYDRTLDLIAADPNPANNAIYQRQIPVNIADFDRIMRIGHQIDPTNATVAGAPAGSGPITAEVTAKITDSLTNINVKGTDFPADANVHFDFRAVPAFYGGPSPTKYNPGDSRAVKLLDCLAFTDRVSDYTINLGDPPNVRGISKIRLPGQINVNTASSQVLAAIPVLNANPKLIGLIMAYRYRTSTQDARIPASYQSTLYDFSSPVDFPGYGIRSLAELELPIALAQGPTLNTLYNRDQVWGALYNTLTVRSDTFVVYAYLEAVRQNPKYGGPFNNGTDWYTNNITVPGIGVTDDPNNPNFSLLRVSRRRWVALIDRSQCNFNVLDNRGPFSQPRILAIKDLPQ